MSDVVIRFTGKDDGAGANAQALVATLQKVEALTGQLAASQKALNQVQGQGLSTTKAQAQEIIALAAANQSLLKTQQQQQKVQQEGFKTQQQSAKAGQEQIKLAQAQEAAQQRQAAGLQKQAALEEKRTGQAQATAAKLQAIDQQRFQKEFDNSAKAQAADEKRAAQAIAQAQKVADAQAKAQQKAETLQTAQAQKAADSQAKAQQKAETLQTKERGVQPTAKLAATVGTDFKGAQNLANSLNLTEKATEGAIQKLTQLNAVNATSEQKFAALSKELGITKVQFDQLEKAAQKAAQVKAPDSKANTSSTIQLAQSTGKSFGGAQQLAGGLGLTADKASQAIARLRELEAVGATSAQKFQILSNELGITRTQFEGLSKASLSSREGLQALGVASGAIAAGIGAIGVKGIQEFAKFDQAIRTFGVVTESSGTPQLAALRGEVERLGAATTKTPQEIAAVSVELGKAGFSAEQTKTALAGVVQSSEATGEGLARTGEVIGSTLNQFALSSSNSLKIADLLTQASNASAAGTNDLGEALSYVGAQAKASNQSVEDTVTTLALLANSGIKGSSAGTGLAEALRRLKLASASATTELTDLKSRGSKAAVNAFQTLDQSVRDSTGKLLPFPQILGKIKGSLGGLEEVDKDLLLNALFGVQGGRVIQTLLGQTDEQIAQVTGKMADFEGASKKASEEMTKGLAGSFSILQSSASLGLQKVGEFASVGLVPLLGAANALLKGFLDLPAPIQTVLIGVTGLAGAFAAAVAVVAAYNVLQVKTVVQSALASAAIVRDTVVQAGNTAAIIANNVAKAGSVSVTSIFAAAQAGVGAAFAGSTGAIGVATGATQAFFATLAPALPLLAAVGGAALAAFAAFDTFAAIKGAGKENTDSLEALKTKLKEIEKESGTDKTKGLLAAKTAEDEFRNSLNPLQQALEVVREKAGFTTATEAGLNEAKVSYGELITSVDGVIGGYERFSVSTKQSKADIDSQRKSLEAAKAALASTKPTDEAGIAAKKAYGAALDRNLAQLGRIEQGLTGTKSATDAQAKSDIYGKEKAADKTKTLEAQTEALQKNREAAKLAAEAGFEKQKTSDKRTFDDSATKRSQTFDDGKTRREQAFQDSKEKQERGFAAEKEKRDFAFNQQKQSAENSFNQGKQARETAFQTSQKAKDEAYENQKKAKESAFQESQKAKDREFQKQQQAAETAFKDQQQERQKAQDKSFKGAGTLLDKQGAANDPAKTKQLEQSDKIERGVANLGNLANQFLSPEKIAALAQAIAGVNDLTDPAQLAAAKEAAAAIEAKQKEDQQKADQEAERALKAQQQAEDLVFKTAQKAEEQKYKDDERKADVEYDAAKQKAAIKFKADEQKAEVKFKADQAIEEAKKKEADAKAEIGFKDDLQKQEREFKDDEQKTQREFNAAEIKTQREFEDEQLKAKEKFNIEQRKLDEESADRIKKIKESAKEPAAPTGGKPPGRRLGGAVEAGQPYLVGEGGQELIFPSYAAYVVDASKTAALLGSLESIYRMPAAATSTRSRGVSPEALLLKQVVQKLDDLSSVPGDRVTANFNNHFSGLPDRASSESGASVRDEVYEALDGLLKPLEWRQKWKRH
ncbi:MAG: phage tail tape measure protein [Leptolyngbya sp.]|nr:MAG: phage tail tape measure protein [Leptolyngbya sp.]